MCVYNTKNLKKTLILFCLIFCVFSLYENKYKQKTKLRVSRQSPKNSLENLFLMDCLERRWGRGRGCEILF